MRVCRGLFPGGEREVDEEWPHCPCDAVPIMHFRFSIFMADNSMDAHHDKTWRLWIKVIIMWLLSLLAHISI